MQSKADSRPVRRVLSQKNTPTKTNPRDFKRNTHLSVKHESFRVKPMKLSSPQAKPSDKSEWEEERKRLLDKIQSLQTRCEQKLFNRVLAPGVREQAFRFQEAQAREASLNEPPTILTSRGEQNRMKCFGYERRAPRVSLAKVLVIGASRAGKSSLINRIVYNRWTSQYKSTIGMELHRFVMEVDGRRIMAGFHDIAGQDRFVKLTRAFFNNADAVLIVCDVSRPVTIKKAIEWKEELDRTLLHENKVHVPVLLIANKLDLLNGQTERTLLIGAELQKITTDFKFDAWYYSSAKEGTNLPDAMKYLGKSLARALQQRESQEMEEDSEEDIDSQTSSRSYISLYPGLSRGSAGCY